MKTYGVIMAGGGGTRFWPLSRKQTPKQLLNLSGKDVMINEAIDRLSKVCPYNNIFIVTNKAQAEKTYSVIGGRIPKDHILLEPAARNTAACIGYAAMQIQKKYGGGIMVITPSDAYIKDENKFAGVLQTAIDTARNSDSLITVGITPTFPATGYGYIKFKNCEGQAKPVLKFVEKPDLDTAKKYLKSGEYVWNSGMFIWKSSVILEKFKELLPDIYSNLEKIADGFETQDECKVLEEVYPTIRSISIDYGVMEKSKDIKVVFGEFDWNDVGSWDMLGALHEKDKDGNIKIGKTLCLDTENSTVYSSGKLIATVGVDNLIIVQTPDAILVCPKDRAQDVKSIVDELKKRNEEELL